MPGADQRGCRMNRAGRYDANKAAEVPRAVGQERFPTEDNDSSGAV